MLMLCSCGVDWDRGRMEDGDGMFGIFLGCVDEAHLKSNVCSYSFKSVKRPALGPS